MIRFGICGSGGFVAAAVLPAMRESGEALVTSVCDPSPDSVRRVIESFDIERAYSSLDEMLAKEDIDAVYIASPNVLHLEQVTRSANSGRHVLCQKPLGMTADECREMIVVCEANDVRLGVGFCNRFNNAQRKAKQLLRDGVLGEVSLIEMSMSAVFGPEARSSWRFNRSVSGGGPLMDLAPHMIDLARFLLDDEVESVQAFVCPDMTETRVEDNAVTALRFRSGILGTLETSASRLRPWHYAVSGSLGTLQVANPIAWLTGGQKVARIELFTSDGPAQVDYEANEHIVEEIQAFCTAVKSGQKPPVSGEDGFRAQAVIDAIYESGRTGRCCQVLSR